MHNLHCQQQKQPNWETCSKRLHTLLVVTEAQNDASGLVQWGKNCLLPCADLLRNVFAVQVRLIALVTGILSAPSPLRQRWASRFEWSLCLLHACHSQSLHLKLNSLDSSAYTAHLNPAPAVCVPALRFLTVERAQVHVAKLQWLTCAAVTLHLVSVSKSQRACCRCYVVPPLAIQSLIFFTQATIAIRSLEKSRWMASGCLCLCQVLSAPSTSRCVIKTSQRGFRRSRNPSLHNWFVYRELSN